MKEAGLKITDLYIVVQYLLTYTGKTYGKETNELFDNNKILSKHH